MMRETWGGGAAGFPYIAASPSWHHSMRRQSTQQGSLTQGFKHSRTPLACIEITSGITHTLGLLPAAGHLCMGCQLATACWQPSCRGGSPP